MISYDIKMFVRFFVEKYINIRILLDTMSDGHQLASYTCGSICINTFRCCSVSSSSLCRRCSLDALPTSPIRSCADSELSGAGSGMGSLSKRGSEKHLCTFIRYQQKTHTLFSTYIHNKCSPLHFSRLLLASNEISLHSGTWRQQSSLIY